MYALVRKAADEIRITILFKTLGVKKVNLLVVTGKKLTNNFVDLVTSGLGPDVARRPPVGLSWIKEMRYGKLNAQWQPISAFFSCSF
jgi:hypothetical protein